MSRRRLKPKGDVVYHHVMTRTAQQKFWLEDPEIKQVFIDLIEFYSKVYYVDILGYVCMSNHTHLCLAVRRPELDIADLRDRHKRAQSRLANPRPFRESLVDAYFDRYTDLSKFMWEINRRIAVVHNKRRGTKGHFWGGRFKNLVVEDSQHLLNVLTYIEMNPVRADLVEDPADFGFSSVGRIRQAIDRGEQPKAPVIKDLERFPETHRAQTYLDWVRTVAILEKDPDNPRKGLSMITTTLGRHIDMEAVTEALKSRAPASWSHHVYGSRAFVRKTMTEAGWYRPRAGPTRDAPAATSA